MEHIANIEAAETHRALVEGAARYARQADYAHKMGDLSKADESLLKKMLGTVTEAIKASYVAAQEIRGARPAHFVAMEMLDHHFLAGVALKECMTAATEPKSVTRMMEDLGFSVRTAIATERLREDKENGGIKKHKALMNPRLSMTERKKKEIALELLAQYPEPGESGDESAKIGGALYSLVSQATGLFTEGEVEKRLGGKIALVNCVLLTEEAQASLNAIKERQQWMRPVYQAELSKPVDWTAMNKGGYTDEAVSRTTRMVNVHNQLGKTLIAQAIEQQAPFVKATNLIQGVPLVINRFALSLIKYCSDNRLKVGKLAGPLINEYEKVTEDGEIIALAQEEMRQARKDNRTIGADFNKDCTNIEEATLLADAGTFYQPHNMDWRGREYALPGFNHQQSDYCKALIGLAAGQKLTARGVLWLKWHIATTAGVTVPEGIYAGRKTDKLPFDARVEWADAHIAEMRLFAAEPVKYMDLWADKDSPFCYLVAAEALVAHLNNPETLCHIPVAIDGSCSGLQHFSAMTRDEIGGASVNLIPSELPQDIYAEVAAVSKARVAADLDSSDEETARFAKLWMEYGITRKETKRNVMTFGYGSKESGFSDQIFSDIIDASAKSRKHFGYVKKDKTEEGHEEFNKELWIKTMEIARYLAKHNMVAIQKIVEKAPVVMKYLQEIAGFLAKANLPVRWTTPMGFPVVNAYYEPEFVQIKTFLWNKALNTMSPHRPKVRSAYSKKLVNNKQRDGIAPNFVHSLDAAHLQSVVVNSVDAGINDFLLIHDSFASLPNQMDDFSLVVRQSMVSMYEGRDVLAEFFESARADLVAAMNEPGADVKEIGKLITSMDKLEKPLFGSLNLQGILQAPYAFS
jgi:DNA-directed RNA polymerase, mitochondrial